MNKAEKNRSPRVERTNPSHVRPVQHGFTLCRPGFGHTQSAQGRYSLTGTHTAASFATTGRLEECLHALQALRAECSISGWGGNSEPPIEDYAFVEACKFIERLPPNVPMPGFVPEPTGSLALEWSAKGKTLLIAFKGQGSIAYAWYRNTHSKAFGSEPFLDFRIPSSIFEALAQFVV